MSPHSEPPVEAGADDVQARPHHTGVRWFDFVLALSAIFISAVSLAVAIEHGRTERDLVAANSWPFLRAVLSNGGGEAPGEQSVVIGVSNGGVGPAKLESFEVFYRGQAANSGLDLMRRCCGLGPTDDDVKRQMPSGHHFEITDHTVLRPGEAKATFGVRRGAEVGDRFAGVLTELKFRACYCSILDECWVSNLLDTHTQSVKACPEPKVRFNPFGR
jgi:hypothetical protein